MPDGGSNAAPEGLPAAIASLVDQGLIVLETQFVRAYDAHLSPAKLSPPYAALIQTYGGAREALPHAVKRAVDDGFLGSLWRTLLGEMADSTSRNAQVQAVTNALQGQATGIAQSILQATGTNNVKIVKALERTARATALVTAKGAGQEKPTLGTGFLVGPDLLLTAAHVITPLLDSDMPAPGSHERASIQFHNDLEASGNWPVNVRLATDWLAAFSPPNGAKGDIVVTSAEDCASHLDFALLRLAEPVENVTGTVNVMAPPVPAAPGNILVIGYTGGSSCVWNPHNLESFHEDTGRIHHTANTVGGMSGGPCLDGEGRAVGLHEGSMTSVNPPYNRSIALRAVRKWMTKNGPDPLDVQRGPRWSLHSVEARRSWVNAGKGLGAAWLESVAPFNPDDPRGAGGDHFHPIFGQTEVQKWIAEARLERSGQKIALFTGSGGTGKSFAGHIMNALLDPPNHHVLSVPPSRIASRPIEEALDFLMAEAGARALARSESVPRPIAGVERRDWFPECFESLRRLVARGRETFGLVWLFIDIGEDSSLTAETAPKWLAFLMEAQKQPWLRVAIAGLSMLRAEEYRHSLSARDPIDVTDLNGVSAAEYVQTVKAMALSFHLDPQEWAKAAIDSWQRNLKPVPYEEGKAAMAVTYSLILRELMKEEREKQV